MIGEFIFIGIIAGLLGLFYRDCLKLEGMLLNPFYKVLQDWVEAPTYWRYDNADTFPPFALKLRAWIALPLGYCIYCSSAWIAIFLYIIYLCSWEILFSWHWIIIGLATVLALQHLTVAVLCKYLITGHPDLEE